MADDSALVLVGPDDTVDTIIQNVRDAGTRSVELLVAEGAPALQMIGALARLRARAAEQQISLLLITSDQKTLNAARLCQMDIVSVEGVPVAAPSRPAAAIDPYSTRQLPAAETRSDDEVLRALDEETRPSRHSLDADDDAVRDEDILATLDDMAEFPSRSVDQTSSGRDGRTPVFDDRDQNYADELDVWGGLAAGDAAGYATGDTIPQDRPVRRVLPDEINLTDDDIRRSTRRDTVREQDRERRSTSRRAVPQMAEAAPRRQRGAYDADQTVPDRRRSNPFLLLVPVLLLLLLLAGGGYWLYSNRATIVVQAPVPVTEQVPFENQVVALSREAVAEDSPAVQAVEVSSDVEYSTQGTVTNETVAPRNFAKGTVTVLNSGGQPLELPQGTQFIATNSQGQDVPFVSDAAATVPPATTSDTGAQIVTQRGQAQISVTARQPGSASNVEANTVKQLAFPGQSPVAATGGSLLVQNAALTGGDEQPVRVVTDQDVQSTLQQALTALNERGITTLQEQANAAGGSWKLEQTTVSPSPDALSRVGDGQVFELTVTPAVGQEVPVDNPTFTVAVKAPFNALAVPDNKPLPDQLAAAVPHQLVANGTFKSGLAPTITSWTWDGERLLVSGVLKPTETTTTVDAATRTALLEALRGKSHADAVAILEDYKQRGLISNYTLPDRDPLPSLNFQLDLEVE